MLEAVQIKKNTIADFIYVQQGLKISSLGSLLSLEVDQQHFVSFELKPIPSETHHSNTNFILLLKWKENYSYLYQNLLSGNILLWK